MPNDEPKGCLARMFDIAGMIRDITSGPRSKSNAALPYERKPFLLTKAERSFFGVLQATIGNEYLVFAMVRLADVIKVRKGTDSWQSHFNRIQSKHIDFLLCDPETVSPVLAIELDDSSHNQSKRQDRDDFVNSVFAAAKLPLLRVSAKRGYECDELRDLINPQTINS